VFVAGRVHARPYQEKHKNQTLAPTIKNQKPKQKSYKLDEAAVAGAVARALDLVNLGGFAQRATHTLSGGQRQRVAIAGALAEGPAVLLLDELTTFLDAEDQFGVLRAVREVTRAAGGGVTAVWVTHR
jgi:ABC-type cobalamin/Fe3+-siderophores transport system ATPase subunit